MYGLNGYTGFKIASTDTKAGLGHSFNVAKIILLDTNSGYACNKVLRV